MYNCFQSRLFQNGLKEIIWLCHSTWAIPFNESCSDNTVLFWPSLSMVLSRVQCFFKMTSGILPVCNKLDLIWFPLQLAVDNCFYLKVCRLSQNQYMCSWYPHLRLNLTQVHLLWYDIRCIFDIYESLGLRKWTKVTFVNGGTSYTYYWYKLYQSLIKENVSLV